MRNVKGALLKFFVIAIKTNKTGIYDEILNEDEKKFISQRILDAVWYPLEYYKKIFQAVFKVEGKGDVKNVIKWGYLFGKQTTAHIYRKIKQKRSLEHAIISYQTLVKLWFDFGELNSEIISDNEFNLKFEGNQPDFDLHYYIAMGWIKAFFEGYLDKKVSAKFIKKIWEGDNCTVLNLSW